MKVLAHTCFIGTTGYANHARSFFTTLNKYHQVKVRNLTIGNGWKGYNVNAHDDEPYMTDEIKDMLYQQTLYNTDGSRTDHPLYNYDGKFKPDVHIVLMEMDHHYYYDNYDGYKIAFCVWESTRFPEHFFNELHKFDEVWVPSQWQFDCLVEQGYPSDRIFIVPEGVDVETFKPSEIIEKKNKFRFLLFGRWDYRKSTTDILKTFSDTFNGMESKVEMICSIDNPYPYDGLNSTKERLEFHKINTKLLKILNFPSREEYVNYLQQGDVFVSCARSEGWNLPLIEAMACGTPSIYSDFSGQLQFAKGKGIPVKILGLKPANIERKEFPGDYCEPDFEDLGKQMMSVYKNYNGARNFALQESQEIHKEFNWEHIGKIASDRLEKINHPINLKQDDKFYQSKIFYTEVNKLKNLGSIDNYVGTTMDVARNFGWDYAIFHEIYNSQEYYHDRVRKINEGDIVVDLGGNIGIFNRWAYSQGASKVISFEPDKRYFKLLSLNSDPKSILFNAAISDNIGEIELYESTHLGGSATHQFSDYITKYKVRTCTLDYLFETGLIDRIDFLKIDIEGAEIEAMKGISDENLKKVKTISMEYHNGALGYDNDLRNQFIERLRLNGFNSFLQFLGGDNNLQLIYFTKDSKPNTIKLNFLEGVFLEILNENKSDYHIEFINKKNNFIEYSSDIKSNCWSKCNKQHFVDWRIKITGKDYYNEYDYNPAGRRVLISFESKSIGDTIAWIPYAEEFRKKHNCTVICSTFHNHLFKSLYPKLKFVLPGEVVHDLYALYRIGLFKKDGIWDDLKHPSDPRKEPLQKLASDILGLDYVENNPNLGKENIIKKKQVSIAITSTAQCKFWNNPKGWEDVIDFLKNNGYDVLLLSNEGDGYMGNYYPKGIKQVKRGQIQDLIPIIQESQIFLGISSGLSWLSWACGTPTIIISGFTDEYVEPQKGITRIINKEVCHGCWGRHYFRPDKWLWCPEHEGTERQFECTKEISSESVIFEIKKLLNL